MKQKHGCARAAIGRHTHGAAGFSLVELMVAIGIVAIIMGAGLPSVRDWIENRQVNVLAEALSSALRTAQSEAIQRNTLVELAVVTSAVAPAPSDPSAATLTVGGLMQSDPQINIMVRVRGATTAATGFIQGKEAADGSTNARLSGPAGVVFNSLGRAQNTLDASNVLVAPADPIVFQITNPFLDAAIVKRRCIYLPPGGAVRICDPRATSGDPRACQPALTTSQCP
ncbi:MAG: GspH/FimT family pseudopilin [Burkholderiales bacterium]|nr:GspH/FimT family pseudopilin [Burkholderiales bacterium]